MFYKNFRARGLAPKFIGPHRIVSKINKNCEIESFETRERTFVHSDSLKLFNPVDFTGEIVDEPEIQSSSSDEENFVLAEEQIIVRPNEHDLEPRYALRRKRRRPERFGFPVYNY